MWRKSKEKRGEKWLRKMRVKSKRKGWGDKVKKEVIRRNKENKGDNENKKKGE